MKRRRIVEPVGKSYELFGSPYGKDDVAGAKEQMRFLQTLTPRPGELRQQFHAVKNVTEVLPNPLLLALLRAQKAFWNHGFKVVPVGVNGSPVASKVRKRFNEWYEGNGPNIRKWASDFFGECLTYSNAVAFWYGPESDFKPQPGYRVVVLNLERCRYSEKMGTPRLWYEHGLTAQDLAGAKIPEKTLKRYRDPEVQLSEADGEFFRVWSRGKRGSGFCAPQLSAVLTAVQEWMSHEAGDGALAMASRKVIRQAKLGHEVKHGLKAGTLAGAPDKKAIDAIKAQHQNRFGYMEEATRFDHEWALVTVDPKLFSSEKWLQVSRRLGLAFSTLFRMLYEPGLFPQGLAALRVEAEGDRSDIGDVMLEVIREAWMPPCPIALRWGSRIFTDSRLASDLLKFAVSQGSASLRTLNVETGLDHDEEFDSKTVEHENAKVWMPVWDPSHGNRPGSNPTDEPHGRPPGTGKG